jgi:hypothetical protein
MCDFPEENRSGKMLLALTFDLVLLKLALIYERNSGLQFFTVDY